MYSTNASINDIFNSICSVSVKVCREVSGSSHMDKNSDETRNLSYPHTTEEAIKIYSGKETHRKSKWRRKHCKREKSSGTYGCVYKFNWAYRMYSHPSKCRYDITSAQTYLSVKHMWIQKERRLNLYITSVESILFEYGTSTANCFVPKQYSTTRYTCINS